MPNASPRCVRRGSRALLVGACMAIACKSTDAEPTASTPSVTRVTEPTPSGAWENLLPSAAFAGFRRVPIDPLASKAVWQVRPDGVLYIDGVGAKEMLLSEREIGDGRLQIEWRFLPVQPATPDAAPTYNGGVYVRTPLDGKSWVQLQVARAEKPPVVGDLIAQVPGKAERVDVFQTAPSPQPAVGEWVRYDVVMRGPRIELSVDGRPAAVWAECPLLTGHVGLQAEGAPIEVRSLRYQPL
ncbi:MAG TPA: DUF1080 domain-containing protein [Polyangiaceae bacterium]|nr:DUF1080 domain-containing protein [Polyangiaceae bacterium]